MRNDSTVVGIWSGVVICSILLTFLLKVTPSAQIKSPEIISFTYVENRREFEKKLDPQKTKSKTEYAPQNQSELEQHENKSSEIEINPQQKYEKDSEEFFRLGGRFLVHFIQLYPQQMYEGWRGEEPKETTEILRQIKDKELKSKLKEATDNDKSFKKILQQKYPNLSDVQVRKVHFYYRGKIVNEKFITPNLKAVKPDILQYFEQHPPSGKPKTAAINFFLSSNNTQLPLFISQKRGFLSKMFNPKIQNRWMKFFENIFNERLNFKQ